MNTSASAALAIRERLAWIRLEHLVVVEIGGGDRSAFLQRIVSADVTQWSSGQGGPAALLTPKGKVVAAFTLLQGDESFTALVPKSCASVLVEDLNRRIFTEDVRIESRSDEVIGLFGPDLAVAAEKLGIPLLPPYQHKAIDFLGASSLICGDDRLAAPGMLFVAEHRRAKDIAKACSAQNWIEGDEAAYEIARIEAGSPAMGPELNPDVILLEAGQMTAAAFNKGCYIGQEPICRIHFRGKVNHLVVGVQGDGPEVPASGATLTAIGSSEEAGQVTSAVFSPKLQRVVGLARVHRRFLEPDTSLALNDGRTLRIVMLPHLSTAGVIPTTLPRYKD